MRKSVFLIIICTLVFCCLSCQRKSKVKLIKVGLTHASSHSFTQALQIFKEKFEEKTDGKYEVKIFHSSQLGGEKEMQEMLTIGSLEISLSGLLNTYEPMFSIFELPFLYRDRDHIFKVNNSKLMSEIASSLSPSGLELIGFYENGFRNITNSVRPIEKPDDLQGLKIRTPENPAQIETMRALGAIPTPMSFSELYTALIQGVVDGQENPLQNIWFNNLHEAQEHLAMTHHIYNSLYIVASSRFWHNLPTGDQKILKESLAESSKWQLEFMKSLDHELEQKMKDYGVKFTYPDRAAFKEACRPAYEALFKSFGKRAETYVDRIKKIK